MFGQITGPRPQGGVFAAPLLAPITPTDCSKPQYSFMGDTDTGINYATANQFWLCSAGASQALIGGGAIDFGPRTIGFSAAFGGVDVPLLRDAAGVLAQRNGTNSQTFRIYNTFTDAGNYERLFIRFSGGTLQIGQEGAGTGLSRAVQIVQAGNVGLEVNGTNVLFSRHWLAGLDNAYDIGAVGANRPKDYFGAGNIVAGGTISSATAFRITNKSAITSPSDGQLNLTNAAITAGVGLDFITDGEIKIRNRAHSANAGLRALYYSVNGAGSLSATVDGVMVITDSAGTSFNRLQLGGTSGSFPALKRSGANLQIRLADDSALTNVTALSYGVSSTAVIQSPSDGVMLLMNAAGLDFGRLQFGGTTSSFPALRRSGTAIQARLADDSGYARVEARYFSGDDATITAGSGTGITVVNAGQLQRQVYKVTIDRTAFVCAAVTCDVTIATLPAKTILLGMYGELTTTFACTATCTSSTLSMTAGTSAGTNGLLVSFDVDAATTIRGDADSELGTLLTRATAVQGGLPSLTGANIVSIRLTSGTGNIGNGSATNLSQGSITFYLATERLP